MGRVAPARLARVRIYQMPNSGRVCHVLEVAATQHDPTVAAGLVGRLANSDAGCGVGWGC